MGMNNQTESAQHASKEENDCGCGRKPSRRVVATSDKGKSKRQYPRRKR